MHEARETDRLGNFWQDACLVLDYVNDEELDFLGDDFIDAILDRKSFSPREIECAKQALARAGGADEVPWFAFHILHHGDPSGIELQRGILIALETGWNRALIEMCKYAGFLPDPLPEQLAHQILRHRKEAIRTLDFVSYLTRYRPLLKRCRKAKRPVRDRPGV